jgi:predicted nucleic acid-binding protein
VDRPSVLIDLNVVLDVLQVRDPFYTTSAHVLAAAETGQIEAWVAAHSLTTLFYLLTRHRSSEIARATLGELLSFLSVAPVDQRVIERALALPYRDYEDAVQMMSAVHVGAQYLVTRNVQDYKAGPLPVLQPAELLGLIQRDRRS